MASTYIVSLLLTMPVGRDQQQQQHQHRHMKKKHNTKTNIQKQIAAERMQNIESSNRPK